MLPQNLFQIHLVAGYIACLLLFSTYILPRLRAMGRFEAQRAIATLHSFRFFGLAFLLPGVVGPGLPVGFTVFSAYGDFATAVLAMLALLAARVGARGLRPFFWVFVAAFNVVGVTDLIVDYYHAIHLNLPAQAGQFGAMYIVPVIYVPMLMITHIAALYWLVRPEARAKSVAA
ncbi:hypothetical protein [Edaphobacter dinghuensis]|uniref:Uncharacterized protein n=1 Tax=Edaphobacter dinghuensis TaxID=1560005 RepID=A0A917H489_9BACT|nr:hypothetical protein [Edaphobacter dinghuensis]GGG66287.1 hypothetical protein GCM10011585_05160 [Edaphobacter dinghuensis]